MKEKVEETRHDTAIARSNIFMVSVFKPQGKVEGFQYRMFLDWRDTKLLAKCEPQSKTIIPFYSG